MCVALPGKIVSVGRREGTSRPARVRFGETERGIDLVLVPEADVGDYVIVHAGLALRIVQGEAAQATLDLLRDEDI